MCLKVFRFLGSVIPYARGVVVALNNVRTRVGISDQTGGGFHLSALTKKGKCPADYGNRCGQANYVGPGTSFSPSGDFGQYVRFTCTLLNPSVLWTKLDKVLEAAENSS